MSCDKCKDKVDVKDLTFPYVLRKCPKCGREMKIRETGKDGIGLHIRKGDRFTIPQGYIRLSANPLKSNMIFTKNGFNWFAERVFVRDMQLMINDVESELKKNDERYRSILKKSELIKGLDIDNEDHYEEIFKKLEKNKISVEWWASLMGVFNSIAVKALKKKDAKKAAWATGCAERCSSMVAFKENYEEVVWMGQSAKRIVNVIRTWDSNKNNSNEEFWQNVFTGNPYVLSQVFSVPVIFIKGKVYVGGMKIDRQDAKFVDFLYTNESSNDAILVEIKTPTTKLLGSKYRGVFRPSAELSGSVVQALDYRRELARNFTAITEGRPYKIEVFNPKCVVIAGNAELELKDDTKRKSFELYRTNLRDVEIVTYDELFRKAESLASLFNLVRKK